MIYFFFICTDHDSSRSYVRAIRFYFKYVIREFVPIPRDIVQRDGCKDTLPASILIFVLWIWSERMIRLSQNVDMQAKIYRQQRVMM